MSQIVLSQQTKMSSRKKVGYEFLYVIKYVKSSIYLFTTQCVDCYFELVFTT